MGRVGGVSGDGEVGEAEDKVQKESWQLMFCKYLTQKKKKKMFCNYINEIASLDR